MNAGKASAKIISNAVHVFPPKDFPGSTEPTALMKCFQEQGIDVPLRKFRTRRILI